MDACTGWKWCVYGATGLVCSLVCLATLGVAMGQDTNVKRVGTLGKPVAMQDPVPSKTGEPAKKKGDEKPGDQEPAPQPQKGFSEQPPSWTPPKLEPDEVALPINLATALRLANVRALDITIAQQQLGIAIAQFDQAKVLWLPNLDMGLDYTHHDGPIQNVDGSTITASRSSLFAGGAPVAVFGLTDAILRLWPPDKSLALRKPTFRPPPTTL